MLYSKVMKLTKFISYKTPCICILKFAVKLKQKLFYCKLASAASLLRFYSQVISSAACFSALRLATFLRRAAKMALPRSANSP